MICHVMEYFSVGKRKELHIVDAASADGSQTDGMESKQADAEPGIPSDSISYKLTESDSGGSWGCGEQNRRL